MYQLLIMWILSITLNTQRKLGRFWDNLYFWFYGLVCWKGKGIVFSNPYTWCIYPYNLSMIFQFTQINKFDVWKVYKYTVRFQSNKNEIIWVCGKPPVKTGNDTKLEFKKEKLYKCSRNISLINCFIILPWVQGSSIIWSRTNRFHFFLTVLIVI